MKLKIWISGIVVGLTLLIVLAVAAQSLYGVDWRTIDSGGGTSQGGSYSMSGTIGQPDAGHTLQGGVYTLMGGFWTGGTGYVYHISLPIINRNP